MMVVRRTGVRRWMRGDWVVVVGAFLHACMCGGFPLSFSLYYLLVGREVVEGVVEDEVVALRERRQVQLPLRLVHHHRLRRLRLDDVRVPC